MEIIKQGVPYKGVNITGQCDKCGCIATFNTQESLAHRNASREDHKPWYPTNYYVHCPTEGCTGLIDGCAPPEQEPTFWQRIFG